MAFVILVNSTTADATDVNSNFYHIAQGSRLPMGGNSLESTDSVYDLGSSAASWNNLFCQNIYINSSITTVDKSLWVLQAETTLSATSASIEFTGLNGDDAEEYKIIGYIIFSDAGNSFLRCFLNGDSAANYGNQYIYGQSTGVSAVRQVSAQRIYIGNNLTSTGIGFFDLIINSKTGVPRMGLSNYLHYFETNTIYQIWQSSHVWDNTADTITSIKFTDYNYDPGTHVELWKRG